MTREEIRKGLLEIFQDTQPDINFSNIDDTVPLADQFGFDSMDFLDILMGVKIKLNFDVPEEDTKNLKTMESSLNYLEPILKDFKP
jgi:acyl carrier protein